MNYILSMRKTRKPRRIGVLTKTFRILELIREGRDHFTLTRIAERTGYDKSTVYRMLNHLEQEGYLHRDVAGCYSIGDSIRRMAQAGGGNEKLREVARPFLWGIWKATSEAVHLGVLEDTEVLYVDALESPLELRLVSTVGIRAEFYRTALGKAMVAFLPESLQEKLILSCTFKQYTIYTLTTPEQLSAEMAAVRARGYAIDQEEGNLGVRCVGAPIFNLDREVAGALSISGPTSRIAPERVQPLANTLLDAAREISAIIGYKPSDGRR